MVQMAAGPFTVGHILIYDACGNAVDGGPVPSGGGGGGGTGLPIPYPEAVPPGLVSSWEWVSQGTASAADFSGGIALTAPNLAGTSWRVLKKQAPASPPYSITAAYLLQRRSAGFTRSGIVLRESATGRLETWGMSNDSSRSHDHWSSLTSWASGDSPINAAGVPVLFLRVRNDGSNLIYSTSAIGREGSFITMVSHPLRAFFASGPDELGFGIDNEGNGGDVVMYLFHWDVKVG